MNMGESGASVRGGSRITTARPLGTVRLAGTPESVTHGRSYVRTVLVAAGISEVDDTVLLAGELMGNAVRHSDSGRPGGTVEVRVFADGTRVRVEVGDEGSPAGIPAAAAEVDPFSESGRGLWLVDRLAAAWGVLERPGGRTVWFECAVPA
ncbi:ATP-binding protein [Sphaerisporangium rufum]|uniref:ATP-binding protein n=1 Tax=Sphaerisporangium rufum TaxID=1381558 RepID=A0A919RBN3_9ACTN|nr:ATP-binding protein [Sphaerisporangium rufum]GII80990.1 ATP-binding protein [Sphaerisporangium rufum]